MENFIYINYKEAALKEKGGCSQQSLQSSDVGREQYIVQYPPMFLWVWKLVILICCVALIIIHLVASADERLGIIPFIIMIIIFSILAHTAYKRYKILVCENGINVTPMIGSSKAVLYTEITNMKIKHSRAIILYGKKGRICTIDPSVAGYEQIAESLNKTCPDSNRK